MKTLPATSPIHRLWGRITTASTVFGSGWKLIASCSVALIILLPNLSNAQQGKGLVFNGKNQFVQFPAQGFPLGASARTLEFWVRAVPTSQSEPEYVFSWGEKSSHGSTFGVFARQLEGKFGLGFWGEYRDTKVVAELDDDQWHFVTVTYDGQTMSFYLDGLKRHSAALQLDTKPGPAYIGTRKGYNNYFEGAIRDISVWRQARTQDQIQADMIPWPALTGNEPDLVAYIPLNEGQGNTFSDKKKVITGTINNGAAWSRPIAANPDPISEGIWFVIQNKRDVLDDDGSSARRMALKTNGAQEPTMAQMPLTGSTDEFLWRTVNITSGSGAGQFKLVNKKLGEDKFLDCSLERLFMGNKGAYTGQQWFMKNPNPAREGTNVYSMTNSYLASSGGKAFTYADGEVTTAAQDVNSFEQGWMLQPMGLAIGYHIPVSNSVNTPLTQELALSNGFKVYATNTVQDWSVLNGHLIWKNMLNALTPEAVRKVGNPGYERKELKIISRYDVNGVVANYPLNTANGQAIFDENWLTDYRGGSGNDPNRKLSSTTITEEMMCRKGVFSRGKSDQSYREFDQTVHEFAHALDKIMGIDTDTSPFPEPNLYGSRSEATAAAIQAWFNSNFSYSVFARTRLKQLAEQPAHYDRLEQFFQKGNLWMPPRWLHDMAPMPIAQN